MNLIKKKKSIISTIGTTITLIAINGGKSLATSGIGTAEVQTATKNIKRVITSRAMPLGRSINIC